jgi:predicted nuclease of predicted toxin-antitoxin system
VKFIVDAQLPRRAVGWLRAAGCDALHTLDLPDANHTSDAQIINFAERDQRAVVTKDADFVDSHTLHGRPAKLLLISTGNISNAELEKLIVPLIASTVREFEVNSFVELGRTGIIVRE